MRVAKVITLAISGSNNKVHTVGDEVNENQFIKGRFDELLAGGYIQLIEDTSDPVSPVDSDSTTTETKEVPDSVPAGIKQAEETASTEKPVENETTSEPTEGNQDKAGEVTPKPSETESGTGTDTDDVTRKEIMLDLDKAGVSYNKNSSKAELYEIWRQNKKA